MVTTAISCSNPFLTHFYFQNQFRYVCKRLRLLRFSSAATCRAEVPCGSNDYKDYGFQPNYQTYQWLLDGWLKSGSGSLIDCKRVHGLVLKSGFIEEYELGNRLVDFYLVNDRLWDARKLFYEMLEGGVGVCGSLWNRMISGFAYKGLSVEAMRLLSRMMCENVIPDEFTLANVLKGFGGDVRGKACFRCVEQIHAKVLVYGLGGNHIVCNPLINFYSKIGRIDYAKCVFDHLGERDSVSCVAMMCGLSQNGRAEQSILLFCDEMLKHGVFPTPYALSSVLSACSKTEWFELGQELHGLVFKWGFASDVFVGNALLTLYSRGQDFNAASRVFEKMKVKDGVSYNSLISGLFHQGFGDLALQLLQKMQRDFLKPDCVTVASLVSSCATTGALDKGRQLHSYALKSGFYCDKLIEGSLLDLYVKCSDIETAHKYFMTTKRENVVLWNVMLVAYGQEGNIREANRLFLQMQTEGLEPNQYTYPSMLRTCTSVGDTALGEQIHTQVIKTGFQSNKYVCSVLIDMYSKHGFLNPAEKIFRRLSENDVVSWTAMVSGYAHHEMYADALKLFQEMLRSGIQADNIGLSSAISACAGIQAVNQGRQIHAQSYILGYSDDLSINNALVSLYARCGRVQDARRVFEMIDALDNISWNTLISGFSQSEHYEEALLVYTEMNKACVKANEITYSSSISAAANTGNVKQGKQIQAKLFKTGYNLETEASNASVSLYARCGRVQDARQVFEMIDAKNNISWNTLISGFSQSGNYEEALLVYTEMNKACVKANAITYSSAISAAANTGNVKQGKQIQAKLFKTGYNLETEASNALITLYSKCGCINDAKKVFFEATERNEVTLNAMITGYSQHGCGSEALGVYEEMKKVGMTPNHVTFMGILSACSHVGLVEEGLSHFESMRRDYALVPKLEHYVCVVDILGRAGFLDRAKQFIEEMPMKPDATIWRTLLSACIVHKNKEIGEFAGRHLLEVGPDDSATYVLISNMYGVNKNYTSRDDSRKMMKERGVKKEPGRSWIEVKNSIHAFYAGDKLHPLSDKIYNFLEELNERVAEVGYLQDLNSLPVEKEKGLVLNVHSERLAIAFGLLSLPGSIPLLVMKNLRVCIDCHNWIKCVSKITNRTIIVRDSYRFHHFGSGSCSCKDYW